MADKDSNKKDQLEDEPREDRTEDVTEERPKPEKRPHGPGPEKPFHHMVEGHYYNELIRIVTILFVGVLALMTFLLTVGLQRPHGMFKEALYTAVVILPLNLLAYVFGHLFAEQTKEAVAVSDAKATAARKRLRVMRFVQQLLFLLAVLAVAWLAFAAAQFFFNLPANPMGGGGAPQ